MAAVPKQSSQAAPLLKNAAAAPVIYFDNAPVHGTFGGNIEVELATRVLLPKSDGGVLADAMCTAHLRCSAHAAQSLIEALSHALSMLNAASHQADEEPARLNS